MSYAIVPASGASIASRPRRGPAIVLVIVAAMGILVDRTSPFPIDVWLMMAACAAVTWLCCLTLSTYRTCANGGETSSSLSFSKTLMAWIAAGSLLSGWFGLAGAWHHWRWSCRGDDDIVNSANEEPQVVCAIGKVVQTPWIIRHPDADRPRWLNPERTVFVIACRAIRTDAAELLPVSGMARVTVDGSLGELTHGDIVEVVGELARPFEPANPGDFDQKTFLQAQGVSAVIRSNHVESVTILQHERTLWDRLCALRSAVRNRAETLIERHLGEDTAPVAQAMLLGSRVQIDDETRRAFRESGMLHILAISGMNVGLLWSWLWSLSRWLGRSSRTSTWIVLIALPVYALVTDANPPIVRATMVAVIVAFGQLLGRGGSIANALALAALVILAWNPSDLFNTGAQLSFLAVFAILHTTNWLALLHEQTQKTAGNDAPLRDSILRRNTTWFLRAVFEANVIGLAVWTMTSPLVAREFHLVSPIGSILTVLLIVPVTIMFWIGYSFLLLGLVWSSAFGWLGSMFDLCLRGFLWTIRSGAGIDLGHFYVPAPPLWWTIGFYGLTLIPILVIPWRRWGAAISVRTGLGWLVLGLAWGICYPPHSGVTCTFISVGHGLGVLIECPNGRAILYDAGGMVGGNAIARTISQAIWASGRSHLDAVVISHADGDHCNALPELCRIVSPRELFVHRSFLDWQQPTVAAAIEKSTSTGTRLRLIAAGQSIVLDPAVALRVLHPPPDFHSERDNPNSIVLCLEYAGRQILLTGDLELEGLDMLLKSPTVDVDVLLSPHHGSVKANPPDLARWAKPQYVVVSTPEPTTSERLASSYGPETEILTTATYGAIRCQISPDGELRVEPFKKRTHRTAND